MKCKCKQSLNSCNQNDVHVGMFVFLSMLLLYFLLTSHSISWVTKNFSFYKKKIGYSTYICIVLTNFCEKYFCFLIYLEIDEFVIYDLSKWV